MTNLFKPLTAQDAAEIVREAAGYDSKLLIQGGGTKATIGTPVTAQAILSSSNISGITLYEPSELVIGARAGTPLAEIQATLAANNQRLAFDPVSYQALLASRGTATIGSIAAGNLSGPRRILFGAARDSLIGIEMINGKGEIIKNGGRVMKNVTGYDLTKLVCGSWGTLGLLTQLYFKLQPCPEAERSLVWQGLDDQQAVQLLCAAMGSPFEVTSAAHVSAQGELPARTIIRIEGFEASLAYRSEELVDLLVEYGRPDRLDRQASEAIWTDITELSALDASPEDLVWKISVKPTDGPAMGAFLKKRLNAKLLYDWSGGLVWAAIDPRVAGIGGGASRIRSQLAKLGGHATLIRAPQAVRLGGTSFQPPNAAIQRIKRAVKQSFDPKGIFNPGLMGEGLYEEDPVEPEITDLMAGI